MKHTTLTLAFLVLCVLTGIAQKRTIVNPAYEVKNTGIYNVTKIELTDTATLLSMHITFVPHWWVTYDSVDVIRDCATGTEYKLKALKGGTLNKYIWMPDSGDSTVVLVYPPLPASVKKIDFNKHIFGISLDRTAARTRKSAVVSPAIDKWIKEQLDKAPKKTLDNYELSSFFVEKQSRLIGCIKGYDSRLGFSTGIIYVANELTREDYPVVIKIEPDGRFEAEIPMHMPKYTLAVFNERYTLPFYIEPGQTLCMILDWDECLTANRKANIRYQFKRVEYRGALASLNKELLAYPASQFSYETFDKKRKTMTPLDFKADQMQEYDNNMAQYNEYVKQHSLSQKAKTLLRNRIMLENANNLFNYTMDRDYYAKQDSTNKVLKIPVPVSFFDFLKQLPLNDPSLLACNEFSEFINRFEYNDLFLKAQVQFNKSQIANQPKPEKNFLEYLDEEKISIPTEDRKFLSILFKEHKTDDDRKQLEEMSEVAKNFSEKYQEHLQKYSQKYTIPLIQTNNANSEIEIWKLKEGILNNELGLKPNLAYEITKVRSLNFSFKNAASKDNATALWNFLKQGIHTPYLATTGQELLSKAFPERQAASKPLPQSTYADVFRKIIEPFKGKVLFVDFWATTCGPCVGGIKDMKATRVKYANNPNFDFIFITDQRSSPEKDYNDFVKEQEMKNTYRLSIDDFNMLRQLFKFNGIPRYVVIDQKGDVLNDKFEMWNFETELRKIVPAYNN
ncbi:TlpA family protein disulfide reductase [Paludibacter jiangxiensis]|uniref:Thiol-disulfide isomerase or thioredoxin n=1 Tax=Paludibacter jiangxiensis TaxID=681398 RepID=A0A161LI53_9BACT|nr:TlpA disulfide reductase family protein [Paludibacter jiangxiensis]GAT61996.1 thiol-disulfide isomerase or thioredoxin [Paludibacter jiangxiensis]